MMELPLRLVSLVIILASNSLQQDYYDKYCDSYAAMRRLTPARYRGLVMEGRKIYQLCGDNLSTLSYNRVCEIISPIWYCDMKPHDTTMGARIQEYAGRSRRLFLPLERLSTPQLTNYCQKLN